MRLMIFCARATRGLRRLSLDACSGRSLSPHPWRASERTWSMRRSADQWGDSFAPGTPTSESGRSTAAVGIHLTAPHKRGVGEEGARSMRAVKGSLGHSLEVRCGELEGPRPGSWHVSACQWVGGW